MIVRPATRVRLHPGSHHPCRGIYPARPRGLGPPRPGVSKSVDLVYYSAHKSRMKQFLLGLLVLLLIGVVDAAVSVDLGDMIKKAEQGDAAAQFNLARMYYEGRGSKREGAEELKGFRLAVEQGHAIAQNSLAVMYRDGSGVARDDEALKWYRLAADQGLANAQHNLAVMYATGAAASPGMMSRPWHGSTWQPSRETKTRSGSVTNLKTGSGHRPRWPHNGVARNS